MLKSTIFKWIVVAQFFLFFAIGIAPAGDQNQSQDESFCLRHKATDRIKTECTEIKGKDDAFPGYKCKDEIIPFKSKDEWEVIDGNDPRCKPETEKGPDVPKTGETKRKSFHLFPGCAHRTSEKG
ncbi:MAG: hypothetical protein GY795_27370 [Desulfobacterales bacterium]|nr:hypothetical protein [Desulfobacterales bacterium]